MNKIITSSVLVGVLFVGYFVFAEEGANTIKPSISPSPKPSTRAEIKEQRDQFKQEIKEQRDQFKQETKDARNITKTEIKDVREQFKNTTETVREDIKKRKEEFKETVKTKKEELENQIKTKREELKTRLEKIKDERKKQAVERIDQQIDALNAKMVKHFSNVLEKLEEMLVRISERADKASNERGLDVSVVRSAVDKAKTAIASARSAIEVQSGKTYTIKITTETTLKTDVGKARQALSADLSKVKDAVKAAQSAVKDAAVALAQLVVKPKVSPSPSVSPTVSPTATPTE